MNKRGAWSWQKLAGIILVLVVLYLLLTALGVIGTPAFGALKNLGKSAVGSLEKFDFKDWTPGEKDKAKFERPLLYQQKLYENTQVEEDIDTKLTNLEKVILMPTSKDYDDGTKEQLRNNPNYFNALLDLIKYYNSNKEYDKAYTYVDRAYTSRVKDFIEDLNNEANTLLTHYRVKKDNDKINYLVNKLFGLDIEGDKTSSFGESIDVRQAFFRLNLEVEELDKKFSENKVSDELYENYLNINKKLVELFRLNKDKLKVENEKDKKLINAFYDIITHTSLRSYLTKQKLLLEGGEKRSKICDNYKNYIKLYEQSYNGKFYPDSNLPILKEVDSTKGKDFADLFFEAMKECSISEGKDSAESLYQYVKKYTEVYEHHKNDFDKFKNPNSFALYVNQEVHVLDYAPLKRKIYLKLIQGSNKKLFILVGSKSFSGEDSTWKPVGLLYEDNAPWWRSYFIKDFNENYKLSFNDDFNFVVDTYPQLIDKELALKLEEDDILKFNFLKSFIKDKNQFVGVSRR